jgi:hypothetical protein
VPNELVGRIGWPALFVVALVFALRGTAGAAPVDAPSGQAPRPLIVTPGTVRPGQTIHVSVTGLAGLPIDGKTGCLGILGPGGNVEQNVSPQFRPQIGTMEITANGGGHADASVPADLVGGVYRVILGGCSPHGNIAPLAAVAQATIIVVGPSPAPPPLPKLPATGGAPPIALALTALIGLGAMLLGLLLQGGRPRAAATGPFASPRH